MLPKKKKVFKKKRKKKISYDSPLEEKFFQEAIKQKIHLIRQHPEKLYSLDFKYESDKVKLCIEIDGKFHFSSEKRIRHDFIRERYLLTIGYKIVRYTGKEVYKNVIACVEELKQIIIILESN